MTIPKHLLENPSHPRNNGAQPYITTTAEALFFEGYDAALQLLES